jgi:hypothetical protein
MTSARLIQGKKNYLVMEKFGEIKRVIFQRLLSMDFVRFLFKMNFRLYSSGSSSGRGTGLPFAVQFHYFSIDNTNYHLFGGRGCSGSSSGGGGLGAVVVLRSGVPVAFMDGMSPITLIPVG